MQNKTICTIEARMGSSRLPGKVLLQSNGINMLELMVNRIQQVSGIDEIVIATTPNKKDN